VMSGIIGSELVLPVQFGNYIFYTSEKENTMNHSQECLISGSSSKEVNTRSIRGHI
jgi:hypothetical protein